MAAAPNSRLPIRVNFLIEIAFTPANEIWKYFGDSDSTSRLDCISVSTIQEFCLATPCTVTRATFPWYLHFDELQAILKRSIKAHAANLRTP